MPVSRWPKFYTKSHIAKIHLQCNFPNNAQTLMQTSSSTSNNNNIKNTYKKRKKKESDLVVSIAHGQQSSSIQPRASLVTGYTPSSDCLPTGQLHAHIKCPYVASVHVVPEADTAVRADGQRRQHLTDQHCSVTSSLWSAGFDVQVVTCQQSARIQDGDGQL